MPLPPWPTATLPGSALACASRSATLLIGDAGLTTSTNGMWASSEIGTKSFCASNGIFGYSAALAARPPAAPTPSV